MGLREGRSGLGSVHKGGSSRMTPSTRFRFIATSSGRASACNFFSLGANPGRRSAREIYRKPGMKRSFRLLALLLLRPGCPGDMNASRTVASLAGDIDFLPASAKGVGGQVVVLDDTGGVALCAHVIPVIENPRVVKWISWRSLLTREQCVPACAPLRLGSCPCHGIGLKSAVGTRDQHLLTGTGAKEVANGERFLAVGIFDLDHG